MFGLGMNNNGTGLILASLALSSYPNIMVPIIFYNLVQHIVAGTVQEIMSRRTNDLDNLNWPTVMVVKGKIRNVMPMITKQSREQHNGEK